MEKVFDLIKGRRSVRSFDGRKAEAELLEMLLQHAQNAANPFGHRIRYKIMDADREALRCPVTTGARLFLAAAAVKQPRAEEAFGYSFESTLLFARSLGLETLWVGGTMDRAAFEKAMELDKNEFMPCISPIGYAADKMSVRETLMRKAIKADSRMDFEELFFDGSFDHPLTADKADRLSIPMESIRLAPSAVNKQPWRVMLCDNAVHFYLKRSKGFGSGAIDMQKIDMGAAMCHFELTAREQGFSPCFQMADSVPSAEGMEYIASYLL